METTIEEQARQYLDSLPKQILAEDAWPLLVDRLRRDKAPVELYQSTWQLNFVDWDRAEAGSPPIWFPSGVDREESNLGVWMEELGMNCLEQFHKWSIDNRSEFWQQAVARLGIRFRKEGVRALDDSKGAQNPVWFEGARLNIVESCFQASANQAAIVFQKPGEPLETVSYRDLRLLTNRVSNSLVAMGCQPGDAVGVVLPMTAASVGIYLGIIQAGCQVVSIADSFAPPEITTRLKIANAGMVFTYDVMVRGGKTLDLYAKVKEATELPVIVIPEDGHIVNAKSNCCLRANDWAWQDFLVASDQFEPVIAGPMDGINILFSSGTTGDPKAIPWNHLTPIKCAIDGFCHQDIQPNQVCVWPTNLGWMMGPWLIFATLINRGTIGLYEDAPMGAGFGAFVEKAGAGLLGVVPTIVKAWRKSREMEAFDWSCIRLFSSTGEASQVSDMVYLSALAGMKPIIEYCGGTEIGGGYITSTVLEPNVPAAFNTPAVGVDLVVLDENGELADDGELFLVPPSIGLSDRLLNRDHSETYFAGVPSPNGLVLRRHGDHMKRIGRIGRGLYQAGGRVDDTMNLGGIKISSAEIERVLNRIPGIVETAAIGFSSQGGPDELIIFAVGSVPLEPQNLIATMNKRLKEELNPLFKVSTVQVVSSLPRTASGKVMRRELRGSFARAEKAN